MGWDILDCTFRDGGYYTDWDFDHKLVDEYLSTLSDLPVQYIELGYRNPLQPGFAGEFYYVSSRLLDRAAKSGFGQAQICLMLDSKLLDKVKLDKLLAPCSDNLGVIRLAVQPSEVNNSLKYAEIIKSLGYTVGMNLMYMHDQDMINSAVNIISMQSELVDWVTLVDSFGCCYPEQVYSGIAAIRNELPNKIGFHGHDNIQLAFANALAAIDAGAEIIDGTILGMGRGAGNLKTELLLAYRDGQLEDKLDLTSLGDFLEFFKKELNHYDWGTSLPYMISGIESLPQKKVMQLIGMRRYSTASIIKKIRREVIYGDPEIHDDFYELSKIVQSDKPCMILGGGASVIRHLDAIKEFAEISELVIIHASLKNMSLFCDLNVKQYSCLPGDEYRYLTKQKKSALEKILGFVVTKETVDEAVYRLHEHKRIFLLESKDRLFETIDSESPLELALSTACKITNTKTFYFCGFDGYENDILARDIEIETQTIITELIKQKADCSFISLTPTSYDLVTQSVYGLLEEILG
ncbi:MAG: hypothetical protein ABW086_01185 [Sedimenticola sp.]